MQQRRRKKPLFFMFAVAAMGMIIISQIVTSKKDANGSSHNHSTEDGLPVNFLEYSGKFASAGQPEAQYFNELADQGYEIIINIAPSTSQGALENEGHLVSSQGMTYLNIPVAWNDPKQSEVEQFLKFMQGNADAKVLLHCQMNMRASAYAFLHRVINLEQDPEYAEQSMQTIWTPNPRWGELINRALKNHQIDYQVDVKQSDQD